MDFSNEGQHEILYAMLSTYWVFFTQVTSGHVPRLTFIQIHVSWNIQEQVGWGTRLVTSWWIWNNQHSLLIQSSPNGITHFADYITDRFFLTQIGVRHYCQNLCTPDIAKWKSFAFHVLHHIVNHENKVIKRKTINFLLGSHWPISNKGARSQPCLLPNSYQLDVSNRTAIKTTAQYHNQSTSQKLCSNACNVVKSKKKQDHLTMNVAPDRQHDPVSVQNGRISGEM